ncbi:MAG: ATP-binding cassette domain-containing protein, partial [Alphaproteobacteria bacterium]|nr:ATP-binding cassette domain-containing protein [Alphaproteobacteria bacterium]
MTGGYGDADILHDCTISVEKGEIAVVVGPNGAGKSTLIKVLSGVHQPTSGTMMMHGDEVHFDTPREAMNAGIATVHQDLGMIPLMSVTRNFFMGREPVKKYGPFKLFDHEYANQVTCEEMQRIGIDVRDPDQAVGTLSGGERQTVAIARAVHFGAKVLILDEPTSALGVAQTSMV